ncbi:MAG: hypothetical protein GX538_01315 [Gammaproteobacteria bacterium]|nr:hypothetical protein [Gammaproteobacteria bacterium]
MEITMSPSPFLLRTAAVSALAVAVLATSGCGWFRKENSLYAQAPENRPLEVPPDLDRPGGPGALMAPDQTASVTRSQMQGPAGAAADTGFSVPAERDEVYARVGQVLEATEGLIVVNSAQLLGTYDVNYQGSNFMIRVVRGESGSHVSAVDPRGQPAQGEEPRQLIAALRSQLSP